MTLTCVTCAGLLAKRVSRDEMNAYQGFLVIAPTAPTDSRFTNFTRIVNYYLEAPPFNFSNAFKYQGINKIVSVEIYWIKRQAWLCKAISDWPVTVTRRTNCYSPYKSMSHVLMVSLILIADGQEMRPASKY